MLFLCLLLSSLNLLLHFLVLFLFLRLEALFDFFNGPVKVSFFCLILLLFLSGVVGASQDSSEFSLVGVSSQFSFNFNKALFLNYFPGLLPL